MQPIETSQAFSKLKKGDYTSNPVNERLVEYVMEQYRRQTLDSATWIIINRKDYNIFIHKQFLDIQDKFEQLSPNLRLEWNATKAVAAIKKYLPVKQRARRTHLKLYKQAYANLTVAEKKIVEHILVEIPLQRLNLPRTLVCIPYYFDNKLLWEKSGLTDQLIQRIPAYAKIHESGLVFASTKYRNKAHRRHDYFSYAGEEVEKGTTTSIAIKLLATAKHEGSHGPLDELLLYLLHLTDVSTIAEGLAGSLGNDGRDEKHTDIKLKDFLTSPCIFANTKQQHTLNYICAPKFFTCMVKALIIQRSVTKKESWAILFTQCLKTAIHISNSNSFYKLDENKKVALFYKTLIKDLKVSLSVIDTLYKQLNHK